MSMNELPKKLLAADEPAPVTVYNADGESPFIRQLRGIGLLR
jgi:hypothetical protein